MKKILFVCYGNICRSPSAQGIFEYIIKQKNIAHKFEVDSAGTHDFHIGKKPDVRSIKAAKKVGVDLSKQKCRQFKVDDFDNFDKIFVMDQKNKDFLLKSWPNQQHNKIKIFIEFDPESTLGKVPDPYYGDEKDFDEMMVLLFDLCHKSIDKLI